MGVSCLAFDVALDDGVGIMFHYVYDECFFFFLLRFMFMNVDTLNVLATGTRSLRSPVPLLRRVGRWWRSLLHPLNRQPNTMEIAHCLGQGQTTLPTLFKSFHLCHWAMLPHNYIAIKFYDQIRFDVSYTHKKKTLWEIILFSRPITRGVPPPTQPLDPIWSNRTRSHLFLLAPTSHVILSAAPCDDVYAPRPMLQKQFCKNTSVAKKNQ